MSINKIKQIQKEIEVARREIGKEALSREDRSIPDDIYKALTNKIDSYLEDIRKELINENENKEVIITIYSGHVVKINKNGIFEDAEVIAKHEGERIYL
jgi:hypothetical protein